MDILHTCSSLVNIYVTKISKLKIRECGFISTAINNT
jgi:hypothetical protein